VHFAQADSRSSTVLRNEFDAGFLECITQLHNCPLLRGQRARLSLQSLNAGKRYSGRLGQVTLLRSNTRRALANGANDDAIQAACDAIMWRCAMAQ
jgi:hypothetical protein